MQSKLSAWEARVANDPHSSAAMTMLLADWRSEREAWLKRFSEIQVYHDAEIKLTAPRTRSYHYHEVMKTFSSAVVLAIVSENIDLLRGE